MKMHKKIYIKNNQIKKTQQNYKKLNYNLSENKNKNKSISKY